MTHQDPSARGPAAADDHDPNAPLGRKVAFGLIALMVAEGAVMAWRGEWGSAVLVAAIVLVTLLPFALTRSGFVHVPAEFQLLAIGFVFATLFLGEVRDYYARFWWWDLFLHTGSGLLLGILGFLLVYVVNENPRIDLQLRPGFLAAFAFLFAVAVGALWEVFEFAMDRCFGLDMQKAMLDDPSGLTDTMWDLIVDTLGALAISLYGYWFLRRRRRSFLSTWIQRFVARNPRWFRRGPAARLGRRRGGGAVL